MRTDISSRRAVSDRNGWKLSEQEIGAALPVWTSEMRRLWRKRILDIGAQFGKLVGSWDVVNESARDFARYGKSRTGLPVWKSFKGIMPGDWKFERQLGWHAGHDPQAA